MDEKALLEKALAGGREALGELLMLHERACYALALRLTGRPEDAEDVCQDAFVRATRDVRSYRPTGQFRSWLFKLVVHSYGHRAEAEGARRRREEEKAMERKTDDSDGIGAAERAELKQRLYESLRQLEDRYRLPITLHYEQGLSYAEAAEVLEMPEGTVATNIRHGLEELRRFMAQAGYACAAPVVVTALQEAPVVSAPATLTTFIKGLALSGGAKSTAAGGTAAAGLWLAWKAVAFVLLSAGILLAGVLGWKHWHSGAPPMVVRDEQPAPPAPAENSGYFVTPRGASAKAAFGQLRKQGLRVVLLGYPRYRALSAFIVPSELRFKPIEFTKLVKAVAAYYQLKVAWLNGGRLAVLQRGANDAEVERLAADLKSPDVAVRREAAWRAKWVQDTRVVEPLLVAVGDADNEVARQASRSFYALGSDFEAVAAIGGEKALALIEKALADQDTNVRRGAAIALGKVGGEKALALLEKALADKEVIVRWEAADALGSVSGEKALALLEKELANQDSTVRSYAAIALGRVSGEKALSSQDPIVRGGAVSALGDMGGERALVLLEKALADQDVSVRCNAARALGSVGGEKALALLEKALSDQNRGVRQSATGALGDVGGKKALALLEKALTDQESWVRHDAVYALGEVGGERALVLLEKALADKNKNVRVNAAIALGSVGGEKALALLEKALSDQDAEVRGDAALALGRVGGEKALARLEKAFADQDAGVRSDAVATLSNVGVEKALALLEKALANQDAGVRSGAAYALGMVGGEKALALLEKALADQDYSVRVNAVSALGGVGVEKALDLLIRQAKSEQEKPVLEAIKSTLNMFFEGAPKVQEAVRKIDERLAKMPKLNNPQPPPANQPPPEGDF